MNCVDSVNCKRITDGEGNLTGEVLSSKKSNELCIVLDLFMTIYVCE